jgi:alanine racemase
MSRLGYRPTWTEVDLSALDFNFRQVKRIIAKNTKIMAVIKCNAYGHGMLPIAKRLTKLGVDYLGVVSIDEGIILRKNKIELPILILGNTMNRDVGAVLGYNLNQTVSDYHLASQLNQKAKGKGKIVGVHIKVDTGMGRLGILYRDAVKLIKEIARLSNLRCVGLFTHFPCADCDPEFTYYQIDIFNQLIRDLKGIGIQFPLLHAANSMGIMGYPQSHFNLVRPGLMLYGIYPKAGLDIKLKPLLSLKSRIIYLKRMPSGQGISYGRSYITKKETTIAVLPVGYGDGYPRNLSNRADVLIKGRRFRISGAVCMDQIMVDVGDLRVRVDDEVVLIGRQGKSEISAEELACLSQTIPYEIVCGIDSRVSRVYINQFRKDSSREVR